MSRSGGWKRENRRLEQELYISWSMVTGNRICDERLRLDHSVCKWTGDILTVGFAYLGGREMDINMEERGKT